MSGSSHGAARIGDRPARAPWRCSAAWSVIPSFGIIVGAIPIIAFAGPSAVREAPGMFVLFFGLQVLDAVLNRLPTNPDRLAIGPVVPLVAAMLG